MKRWRDLVSTACGLMAAAFLAAMMLLTVADVTLRAAFNLPLRGVYELIELLLAATFFVALPAVFPFYVTGAITASGGSWNAAIVAELATWGQRQVQAHGIGAYIARATAAGDFHRVVLGIATMSVFIVLINRFFWRPLYYFAERRFRLG